MAAETEIGIHFGPGEIVAIPWRDLGVLTQTRQTIEDGSLEELITAIEARDKSGIPRNELLHTPVVNRLVPDEARKYVKDLNDCHRTTHELVDLPQAEDGGYNVIIGGHRRRLAIKQAILRQGGSLALSTVDCNPRYDLPFGEALRIQMAENTYTPLPAVEEAHAIQFAWRYGKDSGRYASVAEFISDSPYGEEKIRNGLKFCSLPEGVQAAVEDGRFKYGTAVALYPYSVVLNSRHKWRSDQDREIIVDNLLLGEMNRAIESRWTQPMVHKRIQNIIASMREAVQLEMISIDELQAAKDFFRDSYRDVGSMGISLLRHFLSINRPDVLHRLPLEEREAIVAELEEAKAILLGGTAVARSLTVDLLDYEAEVRESEVDALFDHAVTKHLGPR